MSKFTISEVKRGPLPSVEQFPGSIPRLFETLAYFPASILYLAMGSFPSVSSVQMDEIAAGLRKSGVRFIWPVRGETNRIKEVCGDMGLVVPW